MLARYIWRHTQTKVNILKDSLFTVKNNNTIQRTSRTMASMDALHQVLDNASTKKYYVEYGGFLSNHVSHGIIALQQLGANESRLKEFIDWYDHRLIDPTQFAAENSPSISCNPDDLVGKRKSYYLLFEHYKKLLEDTYDGNLENLIGNEFPKLADGMQASLLHGMIQLGYGFAVQDVQITVEGLAYLHHSYLPLVLSDEGKALPIGEGTQEITDVLGEVRKNTEIMDFMLSEHLKPEWAERDAKGTQLKIGALSKNRGDELAKYVSKIKVPDWFDVGSHDLSQMNRLMAWIVQCTIKLYSIAEMQNDFVLLHGVTSAWSLYQILPCVQDYTQAAHIVKVYLCTLLAAYISIGAHPLNVNTAVLPEGRRALSTSWDTIRGDAVALKDADEHIYKLVQVCCDMDKENKDTSLSELYKTAALIALNYPLHMGATGSHAAQLKTKPSQV